MKTEIKSYGDEDTDFYDNEMPKVGCSYTCLAVITIDSVLKKRWKLLPAGAFCWWPRNFFLWFWWKIIFPLIKA